MQRVVLRAKLHRATVTDAALMAHRARMVRGDADNRVREEVAVS